MTYAGVEAHRRLRPLTFPSATHACTGENPETRANCQPFSEPLKTNTLPTRVTEDDHALAHVKKT